MRSRAASMSLNVITRSQSWRKIDNRQLLPRKHSGRLQLRVERVPNALRELLGIERLGQKEHSVVDALQRFVEISGNKNNFCVRTDFAQPIGEMATAHLGHDHVGK